MISRGVRAIIALSLASALVSCASQAPDSFAPGPAPGAVTEAPAARAPVPPDPDPWPRPLQLSSVDSAAAVGKAGRLIAPDSVTLRFGLFWQRGDMLLGVTP